MASLMTETVAIIIPTFGVIEEWGELADRAYFSAVHQTRQAEIFRVHAETLQEARNYGATEAEADWLIFLDADDELDRYYVEAMIGGTGDIRRPSTVGFSNGVQEGEPNMIPEKDLFKQNYIVIGAMVRRDLFLACGGFDDLPLLEDWDLWLNLVTRGATVEEVPNAIYRIHFSPNSRNLNQTHGANIYNLIRKRYEHHRLHGSA